MYKALYKVPAEWGSIYCDILTFCNDNNPNFKPLCSAMFRHQTHNLINKSDSQNYKVYYVIPMPILC